MLAALGANSVLTEPALGMKGAVDKAQEIYDSNPQQYFLPQQFDNPANPQTHVLTTAPEIFHATAGKVDALVAGVGTGGTPGIARYFKQVKNQPLYTVATEPAESPIITQTLWASPFNSSAAQNPRHWRQFYSPKI